MVRIVLKGSYPYIQSGGIWGTHYYSASLKNNKKTDNFRNHPPILVLTC